MGKLLQFPTSDPSPICVNAGPLPRRAPSLVPRSETAIALFTSYLRRERGATENTVKNYLGDIRQFEKWLQDRTLESASRDDVQNYLVKRMAEGLSGRSAQRKHAVLQAFYRLLRDEEMIAFNPVRGVPSPKFTKALPKTLTAEEVDKLVSWMATVKDEHGRKFPIRDKAIMLTLFASGLRASELINLKLEDLDLTNSVIKVWNGKGGKDGIVPLNPPAIEALTAYIRDVRPQHDPAGKYQNVFLTYHCAPMSRQGLFYRLRDIGRQALGRDIWPHQFRHACATALLKGGADIRDVQAILRHAGVDTTQSYLHTDITYIKGIYERSHPRA